MGNAAITVHYPTILEAEMPNLLSGKLLEKTPSTIRIGKKDGAAVGCGVRVILKKTVLEREWHYECTKGRTIHI